MRRFNEIYFIIGLDLRCGRYQNLDIYIIAISNKLQKTRFSKEKSVENVFTLASHIYLFKNWI
jgi:hypothetical protein